MSEEMAGDGLAKGPVFNIQKIYLKDTSFETPHSPEVFKLEWRPDIHIDLQTKVADLGNAFFEVVLVLTVTAKLGEQPAFLAEVHQAGIFIIEGFERGQQQHLLGSICPNVLYPYAREALSSLISKGGFPQLLLAPVNFEALYREHLESQEAQTQAQQTEQPTAEPVI